MVNKDCNKEKNQGIQIDTHITEIMELAGREFKSLHEYTQVFKEKHEQNKK